MNELSRSIRMKLPFFIPPPDSRSESEIEADIADEILFHLRESAREFREAGETEEAARALAKEQFGNVEGYKRQMKRIALKERIMLQRINLALMIIVILVVGAVSVQVFTTQRYNTLALQAITAKLADMETSAQSAAKTGYVIVEGDLEKPGRYAFSLEDNETLNDLIARLEVDPGRQVMYQNVEYSADSLLKKGGMRILLRDGETITIYDDGGARIATVAELPGKWRQIDEKGNVVEDGITFQITDPNDFMNLSRTTYCRVDHPVILTAVRAWLGENSSFSPARAILYFDRPRAASDYLDVNIEEDLGGKQTRQMGVSGNGRWQIKKDGRLYLNLGLVSPVPGEPLIFEKVE